MRAFKPIITLFLTVAFVTLMIPALLVLPFSKDKEGGKLSEAVEQPIENVDTTEVSGVDVAVYRSAEEEIQTIPLESYVVGVVATEMYADFELEALKAQSLAARTYIVDLLLTDNVVGVPKGADVTDTELHQVYRNDAELKKSWGSDYTWKIKKIKDAVNATKGQILTYDGKPITASFFSTSNGYTENSEDIWTSAYPYLKSVASPWDKSSPKFYNNETISVADFQKRLGVKLPAGNEIGTVKARTKGNRVSKVVIAGKELTGVEVRDSLGLKSTDFTWERKGKNIIITTRGFGHGVGMSQYGANGMAIEGKKSDEIVKYYYQGVTIQPSNAILNTITAKK
ncbi:stage II sporulation protein D [Peribacillus sp. NPDC096379]|uniref:stage II sporulation protein D n=1 Tax=Peribacillus sp. NPDC096379 TaxID=3364393 RepID=UPI000AB42251